MSDPSRDLQGLLDAVVENAAHACSADDVVIGLRDGDVMQVYAHYGPLPFARGLRFPIDSGRVMGRVMLDGETVQVADILAEPNEPLLRQLAEQQGWRSAVLVPLVSGAEMLGAIAVRRVEPRPFTASEVRQVETVARLAAVAVEREQLREAVEQRNVELADALDRERVTAEVLEVISRSPTDLQPVLDAIARNAAQISHAFDVRIWLVEGDRLLLVAHHGSLPANTTNSPFSDFDGVMRDRRSVAIDDALQHDSPRVREIARQNGMRSVLNTPLLRAGDVIGIIGARRDEVRPFTDAEIQLLETFAAQAVIAIENARLFSELNERNADLHGALERQTATSEVLAVIARSPTDTQQVFAAITEAAARVCHAAGAVLRLVEGDNLRVAARFGSTNVGTNDLVPIAEGLNPANISGTARAVAMRGTVRSDRQFTYLPNGEAWRFPDPEFWPVGHVSISVPLLKGGEALGALIAQRNNSVRFDDNEAALLETFADQAVIALKNARLFDELQAKTREQAETLEEQAASNRILEIISQSPTDVQPVLDAIVAAAAQVCSAYDVQLRLLHDDGLLHLDAHFGPIASASTIDPLLGGTPGLALAKKRTLHVPDYEERPDLEPGELAAAVGYGFRASLVTPLLQTEIAIGVIRLRRREPVAFTDRQIALLESFARQAVIAIQNVRLFTELGQRNAELHEALAYQTATAEVLEIISRSPSDVQPVLDAIVESAARVCGIDDLVLRLHEGGLSRARAHFGPLPAPVPEAPTDEPAFQWVGEHGTLHVPDVLAPPHELPTSMRQVRGVRTRLIVPLRQQGNLVGVLNARRLEVRPFTPAQIRLLETFADQAVIALENVRLFDELKAALDRQTATSEVLHIISSSPTDVTPVYEAIARAAARVLNTAGATVWVRDGDELHVVAHESEGWRVTRHEVGYRAPIAGGVGVSLRAFRERRTVHVPDIQEQDMFRSILATPMWLEGEPVGVVAVNRLGVNRTEQRPFTADEIALLETFAAQAVIATENVRLFHELEAKNAELEVASKHKSDFLSHMSHELRTPLNAVISFSEMLAEDATDNGHEDYLPDLQEINSAGKHLLGLINDILDLAKIEAGRMDVILEEFAISDLVREVQAMAQPLVAKNGNTFVVDCPADVGLMMSDVTKVRQGLLNLLSNAAKFTERGTVTLRVERDPPHPNLPPPGGKGPSSPPLRAGEGEMPSSPIRIKLSAYV